MQLLNTAQLNRTLLLVVCFGLALGLPGKIFAQAEPGQPVAVATSELPDSPGVAWARAQDNSASQNSAQSGKSSINSNWNLTTEYYGRTNSKAAAAGRDGRRGGA